MSNVTFVKLLAGLLIVFCMGTLYAAWVVAVPLASSRPPAGPTKTPPASTQPSGLSCHAGLPPVTSPYLAEALADARRAGVDERVFIWQIWQKSGFQPAVVSPAGAIGIAQLLPATAHGLGVDPWNQTEALAAAARLDAGHLHQFATQAQALDAHYGGSEARYRSGLALSAYNAGPGATQSAWDQAYAGGTAWPASGPWVWLGWLGRETQRYVPAVLGCRL